MNYLFISGVLPVIPDSRIDLKDIRHLQKLFIKNLFAAIVPHQDFVVTVLTDDNSPEYSELSDELLTEGIRILTLNKSFYNQFLKNDGNTTSNRYIFMKSCLLGFQRNSLLKLLSFLESEEEVCHYATTTSGEVVLFAMNRFNGFLNKMDLTNLTNEQKFLRTASGYDMRIDKIHFGSNLFIPSNLAELQKYISDRTHEPLNDPSLYKDFNLLFIEYKPVMES